MAKQLVYNRIKDELQKQGRTQGWLAEKMDLDLQTVNRYCGNRRQPSLETLFKIAKALKISPRQLIKE